MTKKEKYWFIIEYLNGNLSKEEKYQFYRLLMTDSEFKIMFKQELKLKKNLRILKYKIPSQMKKDIYIDVLKNKESKERGIVRDLSDMILGEICQLTMPRMALGFINKTMKG